MLKPYQKCYVNTIEGSRLDCIFMGYQINNLTARGHRWASLERMDTGQQFWIRANKVYKRYERDLIWGDES